MTPRQWLLITAVVILNIVVFGALIGPPQVRQGDVSVATRTPYPTFTPMPRPTDTAIVMPTLYREPTPTEIETPSTLVHVVAEGETLQTIADQYDVGAFVLRMVNRIPDDQDVREGQHLVVPVTQ